MSATPSPSPFYNTITNAYSSNNATYTLCPTSLSGGFNLMTSGKPSTQNGYALVKGDTCVYAYINPFATNTENQQICPNNLTNMTLNGQYVFSNTNNEDGTNYTYQGTICQYLSNS